MTKSTVAKGSDDQKERPDNTCHINPLIEHMLPTNPAKIPGLAAGIFCNRLLRQSHAADGAMTPGEWKKQSGLLA
jgi:hypothetical protein